MAKLLAKRRDCRHPVGLVRGRREGHPLRLGAAARLGNPRGRERVPCPKTARGLGSPRPATFYRMRRSPYTDRYRTKSWCVACRRVPLGNSQVLLPQSRLSRRVVPRSGQQNRVSTTEFGMPNYRVSFAKQILGVPFTVGSVEISRARDPRRAQRAAELRFARQHGVEDWRERADHVAVESAQA